MRVLGTDYFRFETVSIMSNDGPKMVLCSTFLARAGRIAVQMRTSCQSNDTEWGSFKSSILALPLILLNEIGRWVPAHFGTGRACPSYQEDNAMQDADICFRREQGTGACCQTTVREMEQVISQRLPLLYRSAFRVLGNDADAEDAVQDALLSAHQHLDQFRGQSQLSTWLVTIVINCARMKIRKRANKVHLSMDERTGECQEYSFADALADRRPNPEDDCLQSDFRARIVQFAARLSPKLRHTFQMRDLDGLTIKETALILGVPSGTVKAQLTRARKQLRQFMSQAVRGSGLTVPKAAVTGTGRCQRP